MKKSLLFILSLSLLYTACKNTANEKRIAKGDKTYGGTLRVNEIDNFQTLFPYSITDFVSASLAAQIYEGLVKFNTKDLSIKPCIAEKWEVDSSATIYTFHLKKGVLFQDNECFPNGKGREVKANDFKYSFEILCTDNPDNYNFLVSFKDRVVGANKFFEESKKGNPTSGLEGVKVIDDYTLQISLVTPSSSFIYILANPAASVIAREAVEKHGALMRTGTGAFVFADSKNTAEKVILKRNGNYHGVDSLGNQLPYLDSIIVTFLRTKKAELEEFKKGNLDRILGLPSESIREMVESQIGDFQNRPPKYILNSTPEMGTQYYAFNLTKSPFNNVKVRKAFCYAIDRTKIIGDILKGEAYGPGVNGISPPSLKGYDITKIKGYDFDPEKAKKLLAEAGYANGKGFPKVKLELNSGGMKHSSVAFEIQKQLKNVLNINIETEIVSFAQKSEDAFFAKSEIFRSGWVADYPSPENFLSILYGATVPDGLDKPSFPNISRYKNPEYDKLFEMGRSAKTVEESYAYFAKAEQIMINDAPIMVLWYEENYRLTQSRVKNFFANPMRYVDYSEVYLQDTNPNEK